MTMTTNTIEQIVEVVPSVIKHVEFQTNPKACEIAVSKNPWLLRYISCQTSRICEIAVSKNPHTIKYVKPEFLTPDLVELAMNLDNTCEIHLKM